MVGPHYTTAQRTFMAVEYARNQGTQNFMEDLIGEFQVRFLRAIPPSRVTVYQFFQFWKGITVPTNNGLVWGAVQCLCSKDDNISAALQMAVEKFVCSRMHLLRF